MNKTLLKTLIRNMHKSESYRCVIITIADTVTSFKMSTDKGTVTAYIYGADDTTVEVKIWNEKASGGVTGSDHYEFHTSCTHFINHLQQRIEAQKEVDAHQGDVWDAILNEEV